MAAHFVRTMETTSLWGAVLLYALTMWPFIRHRMRFGVFPQDEMTPRSRPSARPYWDRCSILMEWALMLVTVATVAAMATDFALTRSWQSLYLATLLALMAGWPLIRRALQHGDWPPQ
jgi:hypothetical protein